MSSLDLDLHTNGERFDLDSKIMMISGWVRNHAFRKPRRHLEIAVASQPARLEVRVGVVKPNRFETEQVGLIRVIELSAAPEASVGQVR